MDECILRFITFNENGSIYAYYTLPVQRGIRGKTKGKVQECLILGVPSSAVGKWLEDHGFDQLIEFCCSGSTFYIDKEFYDGMDK